MIRLIQIMVLVLLPLFAYAQDYACFIPGNKQYYINSNGYLRGTRIDSTKIVNGNKVLYPFRSPRGRYQWAQVLDTNSGSWMGKSLTVRNDGTYEIENYWGDTVFIKTLAGLNDEWNLFNDTTETYYTAKITSVDTMTVLGSIDSVKEITVTANNSSGILTSDILNNATLLLSKTHGFVEVCDLYLFPLHEPGKQINFDFDYFLDKSVNYTNNARQDELIFKLVDFSIPTVAEIFDYKPGDKLGYRINEATTEKLIKDEIITKVNSGAPGQVTHRVSRWIQTTTRTGSAPPVSKTEAQWYDRTEGMYDWSDLKYMPEEWGQKMFYHYLPEDNSECFVSPKYGIHDNFIVWNGTVNTFEPCGWGATYKVGLGKILEGICYNPPGDIYSWDLIYSNKNKQDCGSITLNISQATVNDNDIGLYPVPCNSVITVKILAEGNYTLAITDMMGRSVDRYQVKNDIQLDVSNYANGVYSLNIMDANGNKINKKFIVMH